MSRDPEERGSHVTFHSLYSWIKWKRWTKNNLSFKINVFSGALQKFVIDANGKEEESKPKHEEAGAKEEEGNETG